MRFSIIFLFLLSLFLVLLKFKEAKVEVVNEIEVAKNLRNFLDEDDDGDDNDDDHNDFIFLEKMKNKIKEKIIKPIKKMFFKKLNDRLKKNVSGFDKNYVKRYQLIHGLNDTGIVDKKTMNKMLAPRCHLPDFVPTNDLISSFKTASKWKRTNLTYKILNENTELRNKTRKIIGDAFKYWSDVSFLSFIEVAQNSTSNLEIEFVSGDHKDGYPFDGPSGVLAHAFFPEVGKIHFDESEVFTDSDPTGTDLKLIAIHEFGHALGLQHSLIADSIMYPYYKGYIKDFKLARDDIEGIQFLYGAKVDISPKPSTTTTTTSTTNKSSSKISTTKATSSKSTTTTTTALDRGINPENNCFSKYTNKSYKRAIFIDPSKKFINVLLDNEKNLLKFDLNTKRWYNDNLTNIYKNLPENSRGGIMDDNGINWFFYERQIFAYNGTQILSGYPKTANDVFYPFHPYTGAFKDKKMYLFKNWLAYEFDLNSLSIKNFHRVYTVFPGLPLQIDAMFKYNNFLYFFSYNKIYKFDEKKNNVVDTPEEFCF